MCLHKSYRTDDQSRIHHNLQETRDGLYTREITLKPLQPRALSQIRMDVEHTLLSMRKKCRHFLPTHILFRELKANPSGHVQVYDPKVFPQVAVSPHISNFAHSSIS